MPHRFLRLTVMSALRACLALAIAAVLCGPPARASQAAPPGETGRAAAGAAAERAATAGERARAEGNLVGHGGPVKAIVLGAGGREALTGSFDYSMIHWDLSGKDPRIIRRYEEHDAAVNAVQFLSGGDKALSAGDDGILRLWNLRTGELVHAFTGHEAKIVALAISDDGKLAVTASWDRTARLWNLETLDAGPVLQGHTGPVNAVAFALGNDPQAVFTASYDGSVRSWKLPSGEFTRKVYDHGWGINCLARLPGGGELLFGALNGATGILDIEKGEVTKVLIPHEGPVLSIAIGPQGRLLATGGGDGGVNVWRIEDWSLREQHQNPYGPIWGLAFTPDAMRMYYAGLDDFVTLWQVTPRKPFEQVEGTFPRRFQARDNMSAGELEFARKCSVCHTLLKDDGNRAGPTLWGVFGRKAGTVAGYAYSPALRNSDIIWNEETIGALFDHGPQHVTPGSKMPLQRITDAEKRNALIVYLKKATTPDDTGDTEKNDKGGGDAVPGKPKE